MKLFSCAWLPSSNTVTVKNLHHIFSVATNLRAIEIEWGRVPSEASTSMEGTLGGMRMRRNLQMAKASARTSNGHQNAIGRSSQQIQSERENCLGRVSRSFRGVSIVLLRTMVEEWRQWKNLGTFRRWKKKLCVWYCC